MATPLFKTKTVKIDTLGEYLASIRNQLNLDIKTLGLLTQIKPAYLENLESGNFLVMPADVYVRGFLKKLANFYHIKEKILIDQYEKERGFESATRIHSTLDNNKWSLTPKTIIIGTSLLLAALALGYVVIQIRSVLVPPVLAVYEPTSDMTITGNSIVVSGQAETGTQVLLNNQPVLTDANGQFTENLILSGGLNIIEVKETNKFGKMSVITRKITAQGLTQPATVGAVNLTVNIGPNSAWLYLEADGVVVERGTMLAGSTKIVTAENEIILTSANAGSTEVVYNGKNLGQLGREGEVIRNVEFKPQ